ncbi:toxin glutamine deamidase domain-containing protein [Enterococcus hirae]|nr:toxin glutamine deamidase domain-containing protein [Enterococcus hirae]
MSVSQADDHNANPAYLGRTPAERKQISTYQKEIDKLRAARAEAKKRWESLPSGTKERKEALELTNGYVSQINKLIREYDKYREKTVKPYTVNCQRCAPTYELRRRGYDVTALPNLGGKYKQVYQIPKEMWRDTDGNVSRGEMLSARSNHVVTKELMKRMKPGERGTLDWSWSRQNSGHIINVERTEGGLLIIDAQTGKQAGTFEEYMGSNKFKTKISRQKYGVFYNRVDDKYIDLDNIDIIVEGARK